MAALGVRHRGAGVQLHVDVAAGFEPGTVARGGAPHPLADRPDPAVPAGEQRDDPVRLAQLMDAQHHGFVTVERHPSIVPDRPDTACYPTPPETRASCRRASAGPSNLQRRPACDGGAQPGGQQQREHRRDQRAADRQREREPGAVPVGDATDHRRAQAVAHRQPGADPGQPLGQRAGRHDLVDQAERPDQGGRDAQPDHPGAHRQHRRCWSRRSTATASPRTAPR